MIYPTVLEPTLEEVLKKAKQFEGVCETLHIDFGDGDLVPLNSLFRPEDLVAQLNMNYQVHLMVKSPFLWVERKIEQISTVIFQVEVVENYLETAEFFKNLGYKVGLSINLATPAPEFFENIDFVQFMTIEPGAQGNPFVEAALDKIEKFKLMNANIKIQVDGGINLENIDRVKSKGVSSFVVGSAILKAEDPIAMLTELKKHV